MACIVVPLDGSQFAEEVLPWAVTLAQARAEDIHLLAVYPWADEMWESAHIDPTAVAHGIHAQLEAYLGEVAQRPELSKVRVSAEVRPGDVAEVVAAVVKEMQADLVCLTTHGHGHGVSTGARGRVADRLIRTLTVPMVVVPPHMLPAAIRSIVVPLDGSSSAERALEVGRTTARQLGASVQLMSVVDPAITWYFPEAEGQTAQEHLRQRAEAYLTGVREGNEATSTATGRPAECIIHSAHISQLIVMTTHAASQAARHQLGSTASQVVDGAHCPVLLVPSQ